MPDLTLNIPARDVRVGDRIDWLGTVTLSIPWERGPRLQKLSADGIATAYLDPEAPVTVTRHDHDRN